ncbi:MAG: hypothetical protein HC806_06955 [Anaerolineae bacterium]|nr:hypothetical protein [Anaerolineae bacterium]
MTDTLIEGTSLLAIDVGTSNTRAFLFDSVEGGYRLVAKGISPTTLAPPYRDASEGIKEAIDQIQITTGRVFVNIDSGIITPTDREGNGVDAFVATLSAGEPIRTLAVGLLDDISLESARNLLGTTYAQVIDTIGMNDRRKIEERIDVVLGARPDLIVIAGGTDGGASKSVNKIVEAIGLASYLIPETQRPQILFAGNSLVANDVQNDLTGIVQVDIAPNVRPNLESEQVSPAQNRLRESYRRIRTRDNAPLMELSNWSGGKLMPTSQAFARIIRFFSKFYPPGKGVLGVDLGAGSTTIAAAFSGSLDHRVYTSLGNGEILPKLLEQTRLEDILRWTRGNITPADIYAYIQHKAAYPSSLPVTTEDLDIEQSLAREILRVAIRASKLKFSATASRPGPGCSPGLNRWLLREVCLPTLPAGDKVCSCCWMG